MNYLESLLLKRDTRIAYLEQISKQYLIQIDRQALTVKDLEHKIKVGKLEHSQTIQQLQVVTADLNKAQSKLDKLSFEIKA